MAIKPLNSVAGYSVGEYPSTTIILANGDITTHNITTTGVANLNAIGNVKVTGGSSGQVISTDGAGNLSFVTISTSGLVNGTSNINVLNSSDITFSSAGNANILVITGTGANITGYANITGTVTAGNVYSNSGTIGAATLKGEGGNISNIQGANVSGNVSSATTAGTVTTAAQPNITSTGVLSNLIVANTIYADGYGARTGSDLTISTAGNGNLIISVAGTGVVNFNGTNIGNIGNVTATRGIFTNVSGNGSSLSSITGANVTGTVANATYADSAGSAGSATTAGTVTTNAQPNITSVGTLTSVAVTGNVTAGNVYANSGTIGASLLTGTLTTAAQPNITSVGTLTSLGVTNKVTAGQFQGDGGNLSNIQGANVSGTVGSATNAAAVLNNVSTTGTVYPTFISSTANGNYALTSNTAYTANVANGFLGATLLGGTLTTAAQPNITSVGSLTSLTVTGNIGANNITTTNKITAGNGLLVSTGALTVSGGNLDVTGNINVTGNLNYSNVTDLVIGDPLIYIGANNTGDLYDLGIVGSYNDGTYYHTGIARNAVTNYWTFFDGVVQEPTTVIDWANATYPTVKMGNLLTTGTANIAGAANVGGILGVTGNIIAANIYANSGTIGASLLTGTLTTAAQPNITSVGTLSSVTVTANVVSGNVYANSGIIGAQTLKGEGGNISNIQGANVSGTVSSATSATTAGTVTTAAQPNITSVGTLTSLGVTGNISTGNISGTNGNLTTANVSGNIVLGNSSVTTKISWASATTTSVTANQNIASFSVTGVTGVEFLVKAVDATGSKYSVATVTAVTDGSSADYSTFGTVNLGGYTGTLAVNVTGSVLYLQVTPASSNSTVWTTQYRFI